MQPWFRDAKLGIFVHYGIYAVDGVPESWSFYTGQVPHDRYMRQLDGFTAARYEPRSWARLFARAGAKYAVLTARHHDGVALWDSAHGDLDVVRRTPAGRDLIGPYAEALRTSPHGWIDDALAFWAPWGFDPAAVTAPVLLWHGARDNLSPVSHARWLAERMPTAAVVVQAGAAHFGALDVLPDILRWLTSGKRVG